MKLHSVFVILLLSLATMSATAQDRPPGVADEVVERIVTHVVDAETGKPVEGAVMLAYEEHIAPFPFRWPALRSATSDANGRLEMAVADIYQRYDWLLFEAKGYAPVAEAVTIPDDPVELRRGVDVPFELRDVFDRPVAGARIGWILGCGHTVDLATSRTDEGGRGILRGVTPGEGDLWPVADGVLSDYLDWDEWSPGDPPLVVLGDPGRSAEGRILEADGTPAVGMLVGVPHRHRGPWTRTDKTGRFLLHGVERHTELSVIPDESEIYKRAYFPWPPEGTARTARLPVTITAPEPEGATVRVEVMAEGNAAVVDDVVVLAVRDGDGYCDSTRTEEDGAAEMVLPPGSFTVIADGELGPFGLARARLEVGAAATSLRLILPRNPTLVLTVEGLPERAWVYVADALGEREVSDQVRAGRPIPVPSAGRYAFRIRTEGRDAVIQGPEKRAGRVAVRMADLLPGHR